MEVTKSELETHAKKFFRAVDSLDVAEVMKFYAEEGNCKFGNDPKMIGKANIEQYVDTFFKCIHSMKHEIKNIGFDLEQRTIYSASEVSYVIAGDDEKLLIQIPAMTVMHLAPAGTEFIDFEVFFDSSPVSARIGLVHSKAKAN